MFYIVWDVGERISCVLIGVVLIHSYISETLGCHVKEMQYSLGI